MQSRRHVEQSRRRVRKRRRGRGYRAVDGGALPGVARRDARPRNQAETCESIVPLLPLVLRSAGDDPRGARSVADVPSWSRWIVDGPPGGRSGVADAGASER